MQAKKNILTLALFVLVLGGAAVGYRLYQQDQVAQLAEAADVSAYNQDLRLNTENGPIDLKVELAVDMNAQEKGLMYRQVLGEREGMLFVFPDVANRAFWMKNTFIPLDLIFMDAGRQVLHIARDAKPEDESLIISQLPAKYVLEVLGGQTAKWGLKNGDRSEGDAFNKGDTLAEPITPALSQGPTSEPAAKTDGNEEVD